MQWSAESCWFLQNTPPHGRFLLHGNWKGAGNAGPQLFAYSVVVAFTLIAKLNKMKHKKHNDCTFTSIRLDFIS